MLHCEQPAVSHPRFPGNVEALSIPPSLPEHRFSHESPLSPSSSTATTTPLPLPKCTATSQERTPGPNQSSKPKRRQTLAACCPCRKRKSRCNGARPRCNTCVNGGTSCVYSVEQGKTQQQASREEFGAYKTVVFMLRRASLPDTEVILRHLKQHEDVNEAVKFIEADMMLRSAVMMNEV
ncbi:hypothetical protein E4T44_05213 [Aureobasidium sp. EXF-8845]|nr:hypothetical protein E4T44_05213 [Aureobasidium sp. EXF-8845]